MDQAAHIKETVARITNIPTLPTVITKISKLLQNPQTSAEEIGKVITTDQALASKVLKLVNSAFYGFPGKISTITHAIVILGFSTVANIVLTASILDVFKRKTEDQPEFDMQQFWMHSISCGAAAQAIAKSTGSPEKEECFIAGLVHDVGKIILCQYQPEIFMQIVKDVRTKDSLFYESEMALFNFSHQEVGGLLAERWNLPKNLAAAIKYHHMPLTTREHYTMTATVHAADIFVRALDYGNGGDGKIPVMAENVWNNLGLQNANLLQLFANIADEIERATIFMQLV